MDNVTVQNNAFVFCRYSIAVLIWIALFARSLPVLVLVAALLLLSAALKVHRAPLVWLYTNTLGRLVPAKSTVLDVHAMRFAHTVGSVMALISITLVVWHSPAAWWFVLVFAALKTTSALGFCPAYKIYGCALKGGCCAITAKR